MPKRKESEDRKEIQGGQGTNGKKALKALKKTATITPNDILNFGKVYGWALYHGARSWNYHSDSGCYDSLCHTETCRKGKWRAVYRPSRELKDYEGTAFDVTFHFTEQPINKAIVDTLLPIIQEVDGLYLQSYNDLRRVTAGRWSDKIEEGNVEEIAQITSPLTYTSDRLKMEMEIRGFRGLAKHASPRSGDSWTPRRLEVWLGEYVPDNEDDYYNHSDWLDANGEVRSNVYVNEHNLPDDVGWFTHPSVDATFDDEEGV